jgi:adenosylmethionine-8-amino-7-oxononanoate aminotransferase
VPLNILNQNVPSNFRGTRMRRRKVASTAKRFEVGVQININHASPKNSASGALEFQESPAVRTKGLAIAVEFKDSHYAEKVASRFQETGLLLTTSGNVITMFPPLNIERKVRLERLKILERAY